jgi:hypothetical protein
MMRSLTLERALWGIAMAGAAIGCVPLVRGVASPEVPPMLGVLPVAPPRPTIESLTTAVETIADGNLFRPNREPASSPTAERGMTAAYVQPMNVAPARAPLILRGVVGGPPWSVVLLGVPGRDGPVVLRQGEPEGGLELRAIRHDTAIVRGRDTTWRLTMSRAW